MMPKFEGGKKLIYFFQKNSKTDKYKELKFNYPLFLTKSMLRAQVSSHGDAEALIE